MVRLKHRIKNNKISGLEVWFYCQLKVQILFFSFFWGGLLFILGVCWDSGWQLTLELRSENACNANEMQREVAGWVLQWVVSCWDSREGVCDVIRQSQSDLSQPRTRSDGSDVGTMAAMTLRQDCTHSANQRTIMDSNDQWEDRHICSTIDGLMCQSVWPKMQKEATLKVGLDAGSCQ